MPDRNKPSTASTTSLTEAVRTSAAAALAGAGSPLGTIGDAVRSAMEAHGHNFARAAIEAIRPPNGLGLANAISAGAAPLGDLSAAASIARINETARAAMESFHRIAGPRAGEEFSSHRFAGLAADVVPAFRELTAAAGADLGARWAADNIASFTGLHNTDASRGLQGLATPIISAADHIAQMRSVAYPTLPAMGSWSDPMSEARSAFQSAMPVMPTLPALAMPAIPAMSSWHELITGTLPLATPTWAGASAWIDVARAPGGHLTDLTRRLSAAIGDAGHISAFEDLIRSSQRTIREAMGLSSPFLHATRWMNDLARDSMDGIADMMRSLWPLADGGLQAAHLALQAAIRVVGLLKRNAQQAPVAVRDFLINWLGFRYAGRDLVTSATLVLMRVECWLPANIFTRGFDPRPQLRRMTLDEHRAANRLSTDPDLQFRLKPLLSLDQPIGPPEDDGAPTVLRDLVPDRAAPDPLDTGDEEFTDPRFLRLWCKLNDIERAILRERGHRGVTWASAAVAVGQPPAAGERLRRKLKRLAAGLKSSDSQSAQTA